MRRKTEARRGEERRGEERWMVGWKSGENTLSIPYAAAPWSWASSSRPSFNRVYNKYGIRLKRRPNCLSAVILPFRVLTAQKSSCLPPSCAPHPREHYRKSKRHSRHGRQSLSSFYPPPPAKERGKRGLLCCLRRCEVSKYPPPLPSLFSFYRPPHLAALAPCICVSFSTKLLTFPRRKSEVGPSRNG